VIARVNGVVITRREFQVAYRQAVDQHVRMGKPINEVHLVPVRRSVVQRMVEEELLVQESRRLGIKVSAEEIENDLTRARAQFSNPVEFDQELSRQHMDEAIYRRRLQRQRAIEQLLERQVDPSVTLSEETIRRFYDANPKRYASPEMIRLRHILIRKTPGTEEDQDSPALRKAVEIKEELDHGNDFASLAEQYSEEPTRAQGGDLGYIQRGQLPLSIETAVFALDIGAVSRILTSEHGFHLFQVMEHRPASVTSFEDARVDIEATLRQIERNRAVRAYIDSLRRKADIQSAY